MDEITGVGVNLPLFDIMSIGGIMEYNFKMTVDEIDTIYDALTFYVEHHKKTVDRLRKIDCDNLFDDEITLVNKHNNVSELINKFEDVEFSRPNLIKK